jgi:hypothetical protein
MSHSEEDTIEWRPGAGPWLPPGLSDHDKLECIRGIAIAGVALAQLRPAGYDQDFKEILEILDA